MYIKKVPNKIKKTKMIKKEKKKNQRQMVQLFQGCMATILLAPHNWAQQEARINVVGIMFQNGVCDSP